MIDFAYLGLSGYVQRSFHQTVNAALCLAWRRILDLFWFARPFARAYACRGKYNILMLVFVTLKK